MKKNSLLVILLSSSLAFSQHLQVNGVALFDAGGNEIVLRGVNYPIIDDYAVQLDDITVVEHKIDQVALSGANCVRFPWYTSGTHYKDQLNPATNPGYGPGTVAGYVANGQLSHLLQYTRSKGMIPILEIHNFTGSNDHTAFQNTVVPFWVSTEMLQVIDENAGHLIINLANEYGLVDFTNNAAANLTAFKNNYMTAIPILRSAGIHVPIMIDAPDYGQNSTRLASVAAEILASDVDTNVLFSVHTYWSAFANTPTTISAKMDEMTATGTCFFLGEIANSQADAPNYCGELDLSTLYPVVLSEACSRNIGWLSWSWDQDCDPGREMSSNGEFTNLTTYGNDIIYNNSYGLKSTAGCGADSLLTTTFGLNESDLFDVFVFPNPFSNQLTIQTSAADAIVEFLSITGETIVRLPLSSNGIISLENVVPGFYFLKISTTEKSQIVRIQKV